MTHNNKEKYLYIHTEASTDSYYHNNKEWHCECGEKVVDGEHVCEVELPPMQDNKDWEENRNPIEQILRKHIDVSIEKCDRFLDTCPQCDIEDFSHNSDCDYFDVIEELSRTILSTVQNARKKERQRICEELEEAFLNLRDTKKSWDNVEKVGKPNEVTRTQIFGFNQCYKIFEKALTKAIQKIDDANN